MGVGTVRGNVEQKEREVPRRWAWRTGGSKHKQKKQGASGGEFEGRGHFIAMHNCSSEPNWPVSWSLSPAAGTWVLLEPVFQTDDS